ncbi:TolC family outer membrane protein [Spectribacter hydrogenoxidans]|uniref:TolC family outer membrane protein n=1 Tax=Spectribacter hydrogenoxidans TaxID=3075608 RepID=A0ABU3BZZ5_9GAMM|nr:TolC family outer membrane protein [Salinisphaera sp. W335]MDT0634684.1 TolC family outer membrane protein [Salinisphaera sp. W335]
MRSVRVAAVALLVAGWPLAGQANKLIDIYELAKREDATFAAAEAQYRADREVWPQARAAVLPSVNATASYSKIEREVEQTPFAGGGGAGPTPPFTDDFNSKSYGVELRQPLFNWGIPATLRQGRDRLEIAELELQQARQNLQARVMHVYVDFLKAQAALRLTREEREAIAADLEQTEGRYEVGEISVTALQEARAARDLSESRIIAAEAALDEVRERLRELTTRWYETLPDVPLGYDPQMPEPADIDVWVDRTLRYNPGFTATERQTEVAREEIERKRAAYIPDVDLVAGYQDTDDTDFVFGGASNDTRIGLEATWALFDGGRNFSEARESRALYAASEAEMERARREVTSATRNAYRGVVTQLRQVQALDKAVESARTALRSIRSEFELGERNQTDVIDARRNLYSALIERARAKYDYASAVTRLRLAAGVLVPEDLARIDALLLDPDAPAETLIPESE